LEPKQKVNERELKLTLVVYGLPAAGRLSVGDSVPAAAK